MAFAIPKHLQCLDYQSKCLFEGTTLLFSANCAFWNVSSLSQRKGFQLTICSQKKKKTAMDSEFFMKLLYLSNSETNSNSFWGLWEKVKESCYKAEANLVRKTSVSCHFLCLFPSAALWMNQMFCLTEDLIKRTKCVKFHRNSSKFRWNIITCTIAQQNH